MYMYEFFFFFCLVFWFVFWGGGEWRRGLISKETETSIHAGFHESSPIWYLEWNVNLQFPESFLRWESFHSYLHYDNDNRLKYKYTGYVPRPAFSRYCFLNHRISYQYFIYTTILSFLQRDHLYIHCIHTFVCWFQFLLKKICIWSELK